MIGMSFAPFITLLVLGLLAALVIHVLTRYYVLAGVDGFMCAWIAAWVGGWLGTPVFGHWSIRSGNVYFIPAALGALYWRLRPNGGAQGFSLGGEPATEWLWITTRRRGPTGNEESKLTLKRGFGPTRGLEALN